ncbi:long-chain-fatty-acid--CoA ligase [Mycobacterium aquaticum]|uniref:Long-chain-fatty-acid--CoA ligase n=1 Tax=Mycobacterium aquaticum TaxID=1927124 RepID=A0A1W9ZYM1_9MYCO|nr:long-chain fatty acid--CoA ligase [Mycobacterium aquaticum]ORA22903.1 hypothetical protein BST13_35800 [Mycobacterium aquaticum]
MGNKMTATCELLFESSTRFPDRPAVIADGKTITYAELALNVRASASSLAQQGVTSGQRLAILMNNGIPFIEAYFAGLAVGATVVPLNPLLSAKELEHAIVDSGASLLVTSGDPADVASPVADRVGCRSLTWAELPPASGPTERPALAGDDDAVVIYTSGTTGTPKGAVLSHSNLLWNAWISASPNLFSLTEQDVILAALPLFHVYGMTCVMNAGFLAGSCLVVMPRFHAEDALRLMAEHRVTILEGVPTMYVALLEAARAGAAQIPTLRLCTSGGAPMAVSLLTDFEAAFNTVIMEGYGLSETSPMVCFNQPHFPRRPGTVGRPVWGVEVEIARDDVSDRIEFVRTGERGEVVVRGHNVFKGYLGRPDATAEVMVDGWFRTGDIGIRDDDGYIAIIDRKKELIIRGGYNVYPREIEENLKHHPAVVDAVVIGRPDPRYGEEVVAVVRLTASAADDSPAILDWISERVARYKRPRELVILDQLPMSATGKVLKRVLAQQLFGHAGSAMTPPVAVHQVATKNGTEAGI